MPRKLANLFTSARSWIERESKLHPQVYLWLQFACFCGGLYFVARPPIPGVAVLLLGVVAAIMTTQPHMTDNHRIGWILIICILFVVEFRSLSKDRREHDQEQRAILKEERDNFAKILTEGQQHFDTTIRQDQAHFDATVSGLKTVIDKSDKQFEATMRRSDRIVAGIADDIRTQTGGDSFAYITFTPENANVRFGDFSNPAGPWFVVAITSHGKYPLREVRATLIDDERRMEAMREFNKHPDGDWIKAIQSGDTHYQYSYLRPQSENAPSGDVQFLGAYPMFKGTSKRMTIAFSSLNGYWNETLHLGLVNGAWRQCLSVMGPTVKQALKPFIYCEPDWPEGRALAEKDWPHVNPTHKK